MQYLRDTYQKSVRRIAVTLLLLFGFFSISGVMGHSIPGPTKTAPRLNHVASLYNQLQVGGGTYGSMAKALLFLDEEEAGSMDQKGHLSLFKQVVDHYLVKGSRLESRGLLKFVPLLITDVVLRNLRSVVLLH